VDEQLLLASQEGLAFMQLVIMLFTQSINKEKILPEPTIISGNQYKISQGRTYYITEDKKMFYRNTTV
jgi:hypothetical protein